LGIWIFVPDTREFLRRIANIDKSTEMERRNSQRRKMRIKAELVSEGINCTGVIENLSERGISLETDSTDLLSRSTRFSPGAKFQVKFQTPSGEPIMLNCKVIWAYKTAPDGLWNKVGMEVVFPPPNYIDFCQSP
jgi:hypothetical protein